jgi:hypothetical protein
VNQRDRGQEALIRRQKAARGVTATYTRGATSVPLVVWDGRTLFSRQPTEPGGASAVWGDRDYLFAVADLAAAGIAGRPVDGDRITETIGGVALTFEIMTPETGEDSVRHSDQTRTVWRVHTKRVI